MDDRFENPQEGIRRLARIAASLDRAGDHATLAVVLHVLGVLKRRAGDPLEGASLHQRAATLAGLSDDHSTLQAALNNLALCRAIVVGSPDGTTLQLLDACLAVCAKFGVGGDSALAETTGAHWAMKTGDIEKARGYLDAAKAIIERLPSDYEQARFLAAQAEVTMASGGDRTSAIRDLRAAVRLFEASGDEPSAARARKRILCMRGRTS
jgi:tetratricopeptide (TPR) repeat protein